MNAKYKMFLYALNIDELSFSSFPWPQRLGFMMSIPLYTLNPRKFRFIQAVLGVQVWRSGGSEKVLCFNSVMLQANKHLVL